MASLELDGLTKRYPDGFEAVKGLTLDVADGEMMILVGPSGCGKSTALRMIAGLEEITAGELRIDGEVVNRLAPKERDIAMVFQSYALYPHMTVRENMGFSLRLAHVDRRRIEEKVQEAAAMLDLTEYLHRRPASLSGGQRQRVAMGRAIVRDPKAFLMDEPLSNLDAKLRVQMRSSIARLQQRLGTTTIYVTHDQTEAMTLGDRVAVMRDGLLQQVDTPKALYHSPANVFVAGFIGSPPMNLFAGELVGEVVRTSIGDLPLDDHARGALAASDAPRELLVGVRPEDFEDASLAGARGDTVVEATVELVESLGSEVYAHFAYELPAALALPDELSAEAHEAGEPDPGTHGIARLHAASEIAAGQRARLAVDVARVHLFDPRDGSAITRRTAPSGAGWSPAEGDAARA